MARPIPQAVRATPASRMVEVALRVFPVLHVLAAAMLLFSPAFLVPLV